MMRACNVDLDELKQTFSNISTPNSPISSPADDEESKPTAGFQRVIQRAVIHVQSSGREEVTGANVLVAIFAERESHAAYFLQEQDMTRYDAVNYISPRHRQAAGLPARSRPVRGADEERRQTARPAEEGGKKKQQQDALEAYCVNLNEKAKSGKIDPLIGREAEINRTIQVLCRRSEEQSALRRRSRRRQDGDRRGPRQADRRGRRAGGAVRTRPSSPSTWARCSPAPAIAAISRSG